MLKKICRTLSLSLIAFTASIFGTYALESDANTYCQTVMANSKCLFLRYTNQENEGDEFTGDAFTLLAPLSDKVLKDNGLKPLDYLTPNKKQDIYNIFRASLQETLNFGIGYGKNARLFSPENLDVARQYDESYPLAKHGKAKWNLAGARLNMTYSPSNTLTIEECLNQLLQYARTSD